MLKNYLKISLRNLWRRPVFATINIFGLAIGVACVILIALFVIDELSYDQFHKNSDRIYRLINERHGENETALRAVTPAAYAPTLVQEFPEVEHAVRFFDNGKTLIRYEDKQFFEPKAYLADSTVFDVFTLPLKQGDPATALAAPYSVVLSETLTEKYFGTEDPIGKTIRLQDWEMTVTGVLEEVPEQSHIDLNVLGSFSTLQTQEWARQRLSNWIWQQFFNYVLVKEGTDPTALESKIQAYVDEHVDPVTDERGFTYDPQLQPLSDVYLRSSRIEFNWTRSGSITYVYAFSGIAVFILIIACLNFMNLSTAQSTQRAREVGMRKVIGARRAQLIGQFLSEATLMAFASLCIGVMITEAALPAFSRFTGKELDLVYGSSPLIPLLILLGLGVGALAGSYPAFFLSSFKPIHVLKGSGDDAGTGFSAVRRALVVTQFAISIALMIGTAVVFRQLEYIRTADLGYKKDLIVKIPLRGDMPDDVDAIKTELLRYPSIASATASSGSPGSFAPGDDVRLPGRDATWPTRFYTVDHDFIDTYGMEVLAGRDFARSRTSDQTEAFILNESAAKALGWNVSEAIGKEIAWDAWEGGELKEGRVIGVARDFHYSSLHEAVDPLVMTLHPVYGQLSIKISPGEVSNAIAVLEEQWKTWAPEWPFEYEFLDEVLAEQYVAEEKLASLSGIFTALAIFVACFGLFGLASFVVARRTKEIGIRKVLGASVRGLVLLLTRDFAILVGVAFLIASPIAYLLMQDWLEEFAYRTDLGPAVFLVAGAASILIALLTVSYHTVKTALGNPVESLRYE